jgi:hypothetical protein
MERYCSFGTLLFLYPVRPFLAKKQDFLEQKEVVYLCYFGYQDPLLRDQMLADPFLTACLLQLQGVVLLPVVLLK